jgi:glycosyltransferase involved in cell wall biosynthesis
MVEKKGFHHLLRACALLMKEEKDRGVSFAVCLVGEGPESGALRALASELGIAGRVEWTGALSNAETLERVRRCTVLAAPSIPAADGNIDGIPNVILEAMALERPVVGSDFSGIPEVVKDGVTGLLVPPGDVAAMAAALGALLKDPERARTLGRNASAFVREHFDARRNARLQLDLVHAALGD